MGLEADQRGLLSRYLQGPALLEQAVADLHDADGRAAAGLRVSSWRC